MHNIVYILQSIVECTGSGAMCGTVVHNTNVTVVLCEYRAGLF